ncbi:MAG TPA: GNAT family N-acetyltransferase [Solirubrobacteraceae bacterium]|nr:GNAT family N-acetyltransferase [Solirubrobacteraceae bacterium]
MTATSSSGELARTERLSLERPGHVRSMPAARLGRSSVGELSRVPAEQWDALITPGSGALRHGFLRAWEQAELRGLRSRAVLAFAEGSRVPVAACPGYLYDLDVPTTRAPQLVPAINQIRRLWPNFLYARTYELGSPTPLTNPFLVADQRLRSAAMLKLIDAGVRAAADEEAEFMLVQNFVSLGGAAGEELNRRNFAPVPIPHTAVVPVPYSSFEEYLGSMRAQYRRRAQQTLKRSKALQIEHLRDFADEADELARLWYAIYQRAREVRREILPQAFFQGVSSLPEASVLLARRPDGSIAAFALLLDDDHTISFVQCGFEEEARDEGAYFRLLYEIVRLGIESGFEQVDLGITTLKPKLDVGAVPLPQWAWLKHRNPLLQRAIRVMARGPLSPPDVSARHVFKEPQPTPVEIARVHGLVV